MAFSSGTYTLASGNPLSSGQVITASTFNTTLSDIATALSTCITKDGTQTVTANIPHNGYKITGLGAATANGDAVRYEQVPYLAGSSLTLSGSSNIGVVLGNAAETVNVVGAAPSATTTVYINTGAIQYYTSAATTNWTLNIAFSAGITLNTALAIGQATSIAFLSLQGSTAYYNSAVQIDGTTVTPYWSTNAAPTKGNASGIDVYTYTIIKTANATYTVLAAQTQF